MNLLAISIGILAWALAEFVAHGQLPRMTARRRPRFGSTDSAILTSKPRMP